ncbi:MAG: SulP family inorganic anion transporter [Planctomycetales bacterium]
MPHGQTSSPSTEPRSDWRGFRQHVAADASAGFLVFLIALPLCLGISMASGFPAVAGIFTAVIGSLACGLLSNSQLTIKGPAAGLIVIVLGAVTQFGFTNGRDPAADLQAYRLALGVGVAGGCLQIVMALLRTGVLSELFPASVVHGMLSAIGVIIISKQVHTVLGVPPESSEPLELLAQIPSSLRHMNPEIALIGLMSLLLLLVLPGARWAWLRRVPAPLAVILLAIPLGLYFQLEDEHTYSFGGHIFGLGPSFLVNVPQRILSAVTLPDFSALQTAAGWKWALLFALIGSLESLLSAKAIDQIDPWRRKTNFDRDLLAVGLSNVCCAFIGGLPMISEIVRSKANIDNGARTRFSGMWHGLFLALFVALAPGLIHEIPLAALAAMLVYTGFRLASPREFVHVYQIGREQLLIFSVTVLVVLTTDLLVGIAAGIVCKLLLHVVNGAPIRSLIRPQVTVHPQQDDQTVVSIRDSAVFSGWLSLKRGIEGAGTSSSVIVDLSETQLVDHTVMERLHEMQREFDERQASLVITGLERHVPVSKHPFATQKRSGEFPPVQPR